MSKLFKNISNDQPGLKKSMIKQPDFNEKIVDVYKPTIELPNRDALILRNSNKLTIFDDNYELMQIEQEKLRNEQFKNMILKQTYDIHQGITQLQQRQPMRTQIFSMADDDDEGFDSLGEDLEAAKEKQHRAKIERLKKIATHSLVTNVHNIKNALEDIRRNMRADKALDEARAASAAYDAEVAAAAEAEVIQKDIEDDTSDLVSTFAPSALSAIPESSMYSGPVSEKEARERKNVITNFNPNEYILKTFNFSNPTQSSQVSQQSAIQFLLRDYDNLKEQEQWFLVNFMTKKYKPGQQQYKGGKSEESKQTAKEATDLVRMALSGNRYKIFYNSLSPEEKKQPDTAAKPSAKAGAKASKAS